MRVLALLLLLAGCGAAEDRKAAAPAKAAKAETAPEHVPTAAELADMAAAADALRTYYGHIGRREYGAAWALREQRPGLDLERFAENFERYSEYRAEVGTPSYPVASDGWVWIDAPVQTWGRQASGEPHGSVGRVTLKRPAGGGAWRIVP